MEASRLFCVIVFKSAVRLWMKGVSLSDSFVFFHNKL